VPCPFCGRDSKKTQIARDGVIPGDLREYCSGREGTLHRLVKEAGFSPEEMCREPAKSDKIAQKYSPLDAEYRVGLYRCAYCSVDLTEFEGIWERARELSV
jgi:hypothetical protein